MVIKQLHSILKRPSLAGKQIASIEQITSLQHTTLLGEVFFGGFSLGDKAAVAASKLEIGDTHLKSR